MESLTAAPSKVTQFVKRQRNASVSSLNPSPDSTSIFCKLIGTCSTTCKENTLLPPYFMSTN
jgi:hypothetical protein